MEPTDAWRVSLHDPSAHSYPERPTPTGEAGWRFRGAFASFWVPRLQPVAVVALFCILFQAVAPWNYAEARTPSGRSRGGPPFAMPEMGERLGNAVRGARGALARLDSASARGPADGGLGEAAERCETAFEVLEVIHGEILARYERVAEHIRDAGLGAGIQARNSAAEASYRESFAEVRRAVREAIRLARDQQRAAEGGDHSRAAARRAEVARHAARGDDLLAEMVAPPLRVPLDPRNLPHRMVELEPREPRLAPEEFEEIGGAGLEERGAPSPTTAPVLSFEATAAPPGPADLAETVEVQLTPEIAALAEELGGDPLAIFDFVRNEIELTWTFGAIQGAGSCLLTRRCNAFDTASLLIALYRASGIPARYAMGTVEVPIEAVKGLAGGFTDVRSALQLMASGGTPVTAVTDEGELVTARFEHVWVEAFLDYVPSRGARHVEGDTWVPLDPSFKTIRFEDAFDVLGALDFDAEGFLSSILDSAEIDETAGVIESLDLTVIDAGLTGLEAEIRTLAETPQLPATAREILGGPVVEEESLPALPGSLPYGVLVRAGQFTEVPESLRHRLRLEVAGGFLALTPDLVYAAPLPALAGRRITLGYVPATEADAATLASFLPEGEDFSLADLTTSFPAYLIEMRPELKVEGEVVATGGAVTLGQTGRFRLAFDGPGAGGRTIDKAITAGSYSAVVLNLSRMEDPEPRRQRIEDLVAKLQSGDASGVDREDVLGELLHTAGVFYWLIREVAERGAAGSARVAFARLPSEGVFSFELRVESLFGAPVRVSPGPLLTDVGANVLAAVSLDGEPERRREFMVGSGVVGSRAESAVWNALLHGGDTGRGFDSMSYLEAAARRGIPIHGIDGENLAAVLPQLQVSGAVKRDVENAVRAGRVVTIPERAFELNGFTGAGYVALDPETGSGAYMISGGLAGGGVFSFDDEVDLFFNLFINMVLTLSRFTSPAVLTAIIAITAASLILMLTAVILKAVLRGTSEDKPLTKEQAAVLAIAVGLEIYLGTILGLLGNFPGAKQWVLILLAVASAAASYIIDGLADRRIEGSSSIAVRQAQRESPGHRGLLRPSLDGSRDR